MVINVHLLTSTLNSISCRHLRSFLTYVFDVLLYDTVTASLVSTAYTKLARRIPLSTDLVISSILIIGRAQ